MAMKDRQVEQGRHDVGALVDAFTNNDPIALARWFGMDVPDTPTRQEPAGDAGAAIAPGPNAPSTDAAGGGVARRSDVGLGLLREAVSLRARVLAFLDADDNPHYKSAGREVNDAFGLVTTHTTQAIENAVFAEIDPDAIDTHDQPLAGPATAGAIGTAAA